ncbi:craniofacial development protein 2-like [Chironomus tepperi]|uniref:craniofacial development protein 2-like n=1 Tax=Chironomus tepperi TaxID=113505 RepID=UPI00391FB047
MGDFNAKVGDSNEDVEHVMGKHGLGVRNENGELLVELCGSHNLMIGGTLFPHKECHKVTWKSPNRRDQNQIDHICISRKWSKALMDVRNKRGADVGSDHHLIIGKLRFYFKRLKKSANTRRKFCLTKLKSAEVRSRWRQIKEGIVNTCNTELGIKKDKREDYIRESTVGTLLTKGKK